MTVELNARFISELNESYPRQKDLIKEGDDHMRLIKSCLKQTFPSFNRTVNITAEKLNQFNGMTDFTSDTLTMKGNLTVEKEKSLSFGNNRLRNVGDPTEAQDVVTKAFFDKNLGTIAWPIGSIYLSVDGKNPSETMGFGVWEAFAQGRVLIGTGSDKDDRNEAKLIALGAKGGEYNHVLTAGELASHTHPVNINATTSQVGDHEHGGNVGTGGASFEHHQYNGRMPMESWRSTTMPAGAHSHTVAVTGNTGGTGSNSAHNNMQPWLGVNIWKRTA